MAPQNRVAVVAGTDDAVLCQPQTPDVRQVAMVDSHCPVSIQIEDIEIEIYHSVIDITCSYSNNITQN